MANKTVIIVAAIAAVIVISSSAFVLMNNSKGNEYENLKMISLSVYGNANEDYTIDQKDVDLINEMISSGMDLSDHPYADANRDGSVTSEDVEIVNKIIKGETTMVHLVDQYVYTAGVDHVASIIYPLRNVVAINPDMIQLTFFFDGDKYVAGYIANSEAYPVTFHKILTNGVSKSMGSTPRQMAAAEWQAVKDLDAELYTKGESIGAILAYNDGAFTDYKDDVISAGIPIIYLRCTDPLYSVDAAMLLGFLMGPDCAKKALNFANDCRTAIADVTKVVEDMADDDRTRFIALCMWKYISQHDSQYTKIGRAAGGIDMANLEGDGSTPLSDIEAITKYNGKIDYILNCRTTDCVIVDPITLWTDSRLDILKKSSEYQNMFFLNMSIPAPCRVLYTAAIFYPDIITMEQANNYFQMMVDKYLSYLDETVSDGDFDVTKDMTVITTYQDYINAGGSDTPATVDTNINTLSLALEFYEMMKGDMDVKEEGEPNYSEAPFLVDPESTDREASVISSKGSYTIKFIIMENPKERYDQTIVEYNKKIGTEFRGGTYIQIPYTNSNLTECMGYYLNTDQTNPNPTIVFGSIKFAGYVEHCYVEMNLLKRPNLQSSDLEKLVQAIYKEPQASSVSASAWAQAFDLNELSAFYGEPFSVADGATGSKAKIIDSESGDGSRYILFDSSASTAASFFEAKKVYEEKKSSTSHVTELITGFDNSYGFVAHRPNGGGFSMIYFATMKDGCFIDLCLRISNFEYSAAQASELIAKILAAQPA